MNFADANPETLNDLTHFDGEPMNRKLNAILFCFFAATFPIHAQSNYATVQGSILDPQHRPIPGARIQAVTNATGAVREVSVTVGPRP